MDCHSYGERSAIQDTSFKVKIKPSKLRRVISVVLLVTMLWSITSCSNINSKSGSFNTSNESVADSSTDNQKNTPRQSEEERQYNEALALYNNGQYEEAYMLFQKIKEYPDATEMMGNIRYTQGIGRLYDGDYTMARQYFMEVTGDYSVEASKMLKSIECSSVVEKIIKELKAENPLTNNFLSDYYGIFGLDFKYDLHYEVSEYTFYYDIVLATAVTDFIDIRRAFGEDTDVGMSNFASDAYAKFYEAGFNDITCKSMVHDSNGNFVTSYNYDYDMYLVDQEIKRQRELDEERARQALMEEQMKEQARQAFVEEQAKQALMEEQARIEQEWRQKSLANFIAMTERDYVIRDFLKKEVYLNLTNDDIDKFLRQHGVTDTGVDNLGGYDVTLESIEVGEEDTYMDEINDDYGVVVSVNCTGVYYYYGYDANANPYMSDRPLERPLWIFSVQLTEKVSVREYEFNGSFDNAVAVKCEVTAALPVG